MIPYLIFGVIIILLSILIANPPTPCPELLTEEEAIRYLRLDLIDVKDPSPPYGITAT